MVTDVTICDKVEFLNFTKFYLFVEKEIYSIICDYEHVGLEIHQLEGAWKADLKENATRMRIREGAQGTEHFKSSGFSFQSFKFRYTHRP